MTQAMVGFTPPSGRDVLWQRAVTLDGTDLILPVTLDTPLRYAYDGEQLSLSVDVVSKLPGTGWRSKDQVVVSASAPLPRFAPASPDGAVRDYFRWFGPVYREIDLVLERSPGDDFVRALRGFVKVHRVTSGPR